MSAHPNNTTEQKEAWEQNKTLGSSKIRVIHPFAYKPTNTKLRMTATRRLEIARRKAKKR